MQMEPSKQLAGLTLPNGWQVLKRVEPSKSATGGFFSTGYIVQDAGGRKGFLKALDYTRAFRGKRTAETLKEMTEIFLFEKSILEHCRARSLRRVVHAIDSGEVFPQPDNEFSKVEYLIFDLADGDVRSHLDAQAAFDLAFVLRAIHHVATGLEQIHRVDVAHQDLKPSNVLVFAKDGSKISDLGRAWAKAIPAPHDDDDIAGDRGYAPPEFLYGVTLSDQRARRFGCDLYHLGSLIVFLFARVNISTLLIDNLASEHRPSSYLGSYEEVLPYLLASFAIALDTFSLTVPASVRPDIRSAVTQLCEPDPGRRGHPLNRQGHSNPYSLERYISWFDRLASHAEYRLKTGGF